LERQIKTTKKLIRAACIQVKTVAQTSTTCNRSAEHPMYTHSCLITHVLNVVKALS